MRVKWIETFCDFGESTRNLFDANSIKVEYEGEVIPTKEGKEYLRWCLKHGYKELKDAPDWDEYLKMRKKK